MFLLPHCILNYLNYYILNFITFSFQPPIPANDWRNIFDATEEGPSCPHPGGKIMSEDCLRLNVYTTKV